MKATVSVSVVATVVVASVAGTETPDVVAGKLVLEPVAGIAAHGQVRFVVSIQVSDGHQKRIVAGGEVYFRRKRTCRNGAKGRCVSQYAYRRSR